MDSEVDYHNSVSYLQGHLSHPSLAELAVSQRKLDATFFSWSLQGSVQVFSALPSLSQKYPFSDMARETISDNAAP